ncbi:Hypothetical predicted protein [Lecanosticta acicola]|uniref:Uncharacterized protein n=1 Tax=Lecanosticta acicola TaxID=111012 RepID=A0AAI8YTS3_9PEZI|nr:Hypothetical predicted protein [Lecanosticta acicola]
MSSSRYPSAPGRETDQRETRPSQGFVNSSLVRANMTPPRYPSQVQPPESALRSTLYVPGSAQYHEAELREGQNAYHQYLYLYQDEQQSQNQNQNPPRYPPATSPRQSRRYPPSPPGLVGGTGHNREHSFTPINQHPPAPSHISAYRPFTPASSPHTGNHFSWPYPLYKQPIGHQVFDIRGFTVPSNFEVNFNEIDAYHPPLPQGRREGVHVRELRVTETLHVNKNDGRTWHLGHGLGETYSGVFGHDDPNDILPQATEMARAIAEKRERPERLRRSAELLQAARMHLEAGAPLVLQRTSFVDFGDTIACFRLGCPFKAPQDMPGNTYYLNLASETTDYETTFCLRCFEQLWSLKLTEGVNDPPGLSQPGEAPEERRDSAFAMPMSKPASMPLSTPLSMPLSMPPPKPPAMPMRAEGGGEEGGEKPLSRSNEIFKSRHADPDAEMQTVAEPPAPLRAPADSSSTPAAESPSDQDWSSPSSRTSTREWRHPPTRFQHIAFCVKPSPSLSVLDAAVIELWKYASHEQLVWELHLRKMKCLNDYHSGRVKEDLSFGMKGYRWDDKEGQERWKGEKFKEHMLEGPALLRKKDCFGRDLSEVLKEANVKKYG